MKDYKSLTYILIGFLAFAWWEAWQQEHPVANVVAPTTVRQSTGASTNAQSQMQTAPTQQMLPTSPAQNQLQTAAPSVVPSPLLTDPANRPLAESDDHPSAATSEQEQAASYITVRTDVMELAINKHGGNIERLTLLKYPESLHSAKQVQLLSPAKAQLYVTGSGFNTLASANHNSNNSSSTVQPANSAPIADTMHLQFTSAQEHYAITTMTGDNDDNTNTKPNDPSKNQLVVTLQASVPHNSAAADGGMVYIKRYIFTPGQYAIKVQHEVRNASTQRWQGKFYATISKRDIQERSSFGLNSYVGAALSSPERPYYKISFKQLADNSKHDNLMLGEIKSGWIAFQQRYFLTVWIPTVQEPFSYFGYMHPDSNVGHIGLCGTPITLAPGESYQTSATLYSGPELIEQLADLANGLDRTVDYGWVWIISNFFSQILRQLHHWIGNWGVCIIVVTVLIKAAFYKLSENSCRSMAQMKRLTPQLNALKQRYADDKQTLGQATMELYKKEGINPLSMGGCLPMLVQIPFFIAFYYVLSNAIEFRQSPFFGWIQDLSDKDPYYILPVLMGLSMWLQQKLSPNSMMDSSQAKAMLLMPIIFTAMFINFPSGLVLYWLVNNLLSVAQQWYINRKLEQDVSGRGNGSNNNAAVHDHKIAGSTRQVRRK